VGVKIMNKKADSDMWIVIGTILALVFLSFMGYQLYKNIKGGGDTIQGSTACNITMGGCCVASVSDCQGATAIKGYQCPEIKPYCCKNNKVPACTQAEAKEAQEAAKTVAEADPKLKDLLTCCRRFKDGVIYERTDDPFIFRVKTFEDESCYWESKLKTEGSDAWKPLIVLSKGTENFENFKLALQRVCNEATEVKSTP
jgi:hypothetical protein